MNDYHHYHLFNESIRIYIKFYKKKYAHLSSGTDVVVVVVVVVVCATGGDGALQISCSLSCSFNIILISSS